MNNVEFILEYNKLLDDLENNALLHYKYLAKVYNHYKGCTYDAKYIYSYIAPLLEFCGASEIIRRNSIDFMSGINVVLTSDEIYSTFKRLTTKVVTGLLSKLSCSQGAIDGLLKSLKDDSFSEFESVFASIETNAEFYSECYKYKIFFDSNNHFLEAVNKKLNDAHADISFNNEVIMADETEFEGLIDYSGITDEKKSYIDFVLQTDFNNVSVEEVIVKFLFSSLQSVVLDNYTDKQYKCINNLLMQIKESNIGNLVYIFLIVIKNGIDDVNEQKSYSFFNKIACYDFNITEDEFDKSVVKEFKRNKMNSSKFKSYIESYYEPYLDLDDTELDETDSSKKKSSAGRKTKFWINSEKYPNLYDETNDDHEKRIRELIQTYVWQQLINEINLYTKLEGINKYVLSASLLYYSAVRIEMASPWNSKDSAQESFIRTLNYVKKDNDNSKPAIGRSSVNAFFRSKFFDLVSALISGDRQKFNELYNETDENDKIRVNILINNSKKIEDTVNKIEGLLKEGYNKYKLKNVVGS